MGDLKIVPPQRLDDASNVRFLVAPLLLVLSRKKCTAKKLIQFNLGRWHYSNISIKCPILYIY